VEALSCVFRAGRVGASTDHSSILFDVDMATGVIRGGSVNAHWYQLGPDKPLRCPWRSSYHTDTHPDIPDNRPIAGTVIQDFNDLLTLVCKAHYQLLPDVPLVGWDVALTSRGVFLLEVNLSCNFFRGSFDKAKYFRSVAPEPLQNVHSCCGLMRLSQVHAGLSRLSGGASQGGEGGGGSEGQEYMTGDFTPGPPLL
jgi:hypothetical protein